MNINVELITAATGKFYGIATSEINSARSNVDVVRARRVAMYLSRKMTGLSLPKIGRDFGGRDHTTVLLADRCVTERLENDNDLAGEIEIIAQAIESAVEPEKISRIDQVANALVPLVIAKMAAAEEVGPAKLEKPAVPPMPIFVPMDNSPKIQAAIDGVISAFKRFESDQFSAGDPASLKLLMGACANLCSVNFNMKGEVKS